MPQSKGSSTDRRNLCTYPLLSCNFSFLPGVLFSMTHSLPWFRLSPMGLGKQRKALLGGLLGTPENAGAIPLLVYFEIE